MFNDKLLNILNKKSLIEELKNSEYKPDEFLRRRLINISQNTNGYHIENSLKELIDEENLIENKQDKYAYNLLKKMFKRDNKKGAENPDIIIPLINQKNIIYQIESKAKDNHDTSSHCGMISKMEKREKVIAERIKKRSLVSNDDTYDRCNNAKIESIVYYFYKTKKHNKNDNSCYGEEIFEKVFGFSKQRSTELYKKLCEKITKKREIYDIMICSTNDSFHNLNIALFVMLKSYGDKSEIHEEYEEYANLIIENVPKQNLIKFLNTEFAKYFGIDERFNDIKQKKKTTLF